MSWKYEGGQLLYQDDLVEVILKGRIARNEFEKVYSLHPYFLFEWEKYRVTVKPKEGKNLKSKVFFGDDLADYDQDFDFWEYVFKNYVGVSKIKVCLENRLLPPLGVEVISAKLSLNESDELFYPRFLSKLIKDLEHHELSLPFEITSPTYLSVEDIPIPPNLLMLYHQIIEVSEKIIGGVQTILAEPHKDLSVKEELVSLHEVDMVDHNLCLSIVQNSHLLMKSDSSRIPLSDKLKGFLPREVAYLRKVETFDTPENQFVKQFLKELLTYIVQIERTYVIKSEEKLEKLRRLKEKIEMALLSQFFQSVDESVLHLNPTSQVLVKKEGYREILEARNKLLLSKSPVFTLIQEKIDHRNIAELYEFWCFFELSKKLGEFFKPKQFKINVETTLQGGLAETRVKTVIGDYELVYNRKFQRSRKESYSVTLKPDFSLQKDGKAIVVFDAKFRFDLPGDSDINPIEIMEEEAIKNNKIERIAEISDILKMHTYKDALNVQSAIILYPGNKSAFFRKSGLSLINDFDEIFEEMLREEGGIGYLSFIPK